VKFLGSFIQDVVASPLPPFIAAVLGQVQAAAVPYAGLKNSNAAGAKKSGIAAKGPLVWLFGVMCRSLSYPNKWLSEKIYGTLLSLFAPVEKEISGCSLFL
jgi:hypothetical protein